MTPSSDTCLPVHHKYSSYRLCDQGPMGHRVHNCNKLSLFFKEVASAPQSNSVMSRACQHLVF